MVDGFWIQVSASYVDYIGQCVDLQIKSQPAELLDFCIGCSGSAYILEQYSVVVSAEVDDWNCSMSSAPTTYNTTIKACRKWHGWKTRREVEDVLCGCSLLTKKNIYLLFCSKDEFRYMLLIYIYIYIYNWALEGCFL